MASENFGHIKPGINLVPNSTTKVAVPGDIDYSSDTGTFNFFTASGANPLVTADSTQTLANKTIDANNNTILNLTNVNLSGAAAISNANLAAMPNNTIKGNVSGISATPSNLTGTQVTTVLDLFSSTLKGLTPLSGGGTANFLRADGSWAVPPGGSGGVTTVGAFSGSSQTNGANITGVTITFGPADATNPGMVSTGTQTFAGNKTLTGTIGASNLSGTNTGDQTLNSLLPSQTGNNGKFLQTDGTNSSWQSSSNNPQIAYVKDVKTSTTNGGTFTSGAWRARDLNTLETVNSPSWITNNGTDNFTLTAGTYDIEATSPASQVNFHKIKLANTTDVTDVTIGTTELTNSGTVVENRSFLFCAVTIAGTKSFQIQHQCQLTQASTGFGNASGFSVSEVYTIVKITKIG